MDILYHIFEKQKTREQASDYLHGAAKGIACFSLRIEDENVLNNTNIKEGERLFLNSIRLRHQFHRSTMEKIYFLSS